MNARYATDEGWADLRAAVPSFAHHWQSFMAAPSYDPGLPSVNIEELATHLVQTQNTVEYNDLAEALERLFAEYPADASGMVLTIGFLETLISTAEEAALPLQSFHAPLGPLSRRAWEHAFAYTRGAAS